jgi:thiamine biosynthesis lipoprotein
MDSTSQQSTRASSGRPSCWISHRLAGMGLLASLLVGCALLGGGSAVVEEEVLGVPIRIEVHDPDREHAQAAVQAAFRRAETVGKRLLASRRTSHVGILNYLPPGQPLQLSTLGNEAIAAAIRIAALSDGAYTPARRVLLDVWGLTRGAPRVPPPIQIAAAVKQSRWENLELVEAKGHVRRLGATTVIDLEGVAVGSMLDEALKQLRKAGVPSALVSTDGIWTGYWETEEPPFRVEVLGTSEDGTVAPIADVSLNRRAFAAIHPPEVFFAEDGTRIHEWIDPRSGRPVEGVAVAGVFAQRAALAAGLAVAAFIHGDEAPEMMRKRPGAQWMLWTQAHGGQSSPSVDVRWLWDPDSGSQ